MHIFVDLPGAKQNFIIYDCDQQNSVRLLQGLLLHVLVFILPFEKVPKQISMFVLFSIDAL